MLQLFWQCTNLFLQINIYINYTTHQLHISVYCIGTVFYMENVYLYCIVTVLYMYNVYLHCIVTVLYMYNVFHFNNNDIKSSPDLTRITRIFPIERISKMSEVPAFKMLGIYFDENLSFDYHIKQTRNKVSKSIFYLNRAKNILTGKALTSRSSILIFCIACLFIAHPSSYSVLPAYL